MKLLRSLTFRLALYYAGLFSLSVAVLGAVYYVVAIRAPLEAVRSELSEDAARYAALHARLRSFGRSGTLTPTNRNDGAKMPAVAMIAPSQPPRM